MLKVLIQYFNASVFQLAAWNSSFIYIRKQFLNAWINFHLFGVIAKDIVCYNVSAFSRSDDRKSKKHLLPGKICLCFVEITYIGTKNITEKMKQFQRLWSRTKRVFDKNLYETTWATKHHESQKEQQKSACLCDFDKQLSTDVGVCDLEVWDKTPLWKSFETNIDFVGEQKFLLQNYLKWNNSR